VAAEKTGRILSGQERGLARPALGQSLHPQGGIEAEQGRGAGVEWGVERCGIGQGELATEEAANSWEPRAQERIDRPVPLAQPHSVHEDKEKLLQPAP
jgi:hypothetical protein